MTLGQIRHVTVCSEFGSLSKAANALFISVSTLSKSISSLEKELGFSLFYRNSSGLQLTEKGVDFLRHAYAILSECNHITNLNRASFSTSLNISCTQIPQAFIAFSRFCQTAQSKSSVSSSIYCCSFTECIDRIITHTSQLAIISMPSSVDSIQRKYMHDASIKVTHLCKLPLNVNVRADHPLLKYYSPGSPFDFSRLSDYPYVSYLSPEDCVVDTDDFSQEHFFNSDALNSQKRFRVNNLDLNSTIVSTTNAFSIGMAVPLSWKNRYNWECIPLPGYEANLYYIYSMNQTLTNEIKSYISFLSDVLNEPLG